MGIKPLIPLAYPLKRAILSLIMHKKTDNNDKKEDKRGGKNTDTFLENESMIEKAVSYHMKKHGEFPTISYLSKATELHRDTISKHLKKINLNW